MATLTRPQRTERDSNTLRNSVPDPFPSRAERDRFLQDDLLEELARETVEYELHEDRISQVAESSQAVSCSKDRISLLDIMPSISYVQRSCLLTLNNLLSGSTNWQPIVPDRRHSMPPQSISVSAGNTPQPSFALHTLVMNLRTRDGEHAIGSIESIDDATLFCELRVRVEAIAPSLDECDAYLAQLLVSLLSHFNQLSLVYSTSTANHDMGNLSGPASVEARTTADLLDTLERQLSEFQVERLSKPDVIRAGSPPVQVVETALLWSKIDDELETVLSMCKKRTNSLHPLSAFDHLPPQYDYRDYEFDTPPEYDSDARASMHIPEIKVPSQSINPVAPSEKMRLDFEAVTMAIDRLYMVAPQLHNQRVELKTAKVEQMEKARREGSQSTLLKGKQKGPDLTDLEDMLDLLGKASDRRLIDQSVILDGPIKARLEKARQQDREQRDAFVEKLMEHSESGRYHTQDAVLQVPKVRDLNGLVSLPEFIRESMPQEARVLGVDAIARSSSEASAQAVANEVAARKKGSRNRSMSAPSLSWLRPSSRSGHPADSKTKKSPSRPGSSGKGSSRQAALDISYIAEHHETLQHVLVFVSVAGLASNTDLSAEVLPTVESGTEGDLLIIRNDAVSSPPLTLPARIASGVQDIKLRNDYYELKLSVVSKSRSQSYSYEDRTSAPLMDATQLSSLKPTNFICTSCSLPLVHSSAIAEYKDLPSEHWEELVDAWMCHADQTLNEQITKHGRGFWPEQGQALVGGSYVLFEDTSVVKSTITTTERPKRAEDWRLVRCMCGAMVGRCQERHENGGVITMYRLLKYAIRPVSPTARPQRVPLSAFIVEDMSEYVQAHATYRFVISDEEDERPRLLMWLFKPSIRLSYMLPTEYFLKKNGSIHAAKVLYKVIRPSTKSTDLKDLLNKYPGFPQAEYLFYPLDICRRLAGLLRESTRSYPESMRTMTGLDVGWLHRA